MKKKALTLLVIPIAAFSINYAQAKSSSVCKTLKKCVEKVSKMTGKTYYYSFSLKGNIVLSNNFKLTKKNADIFISSLLNDNGLTRTPWLNGNFKIINARDIRYTPTSIYQIGVTPLPDHSDYIMASYLLKNSKSSGITRTFRPFMSRYGRIIDYKRNNMIVIQDTPQNIKRLIKLIKIIDVKKNYTTLEIQEEKEKKEHKRKLEILQAQNGHRFTEELKNLKHMINKIKMK